MLLQTPSSIENALWENQLVPSSDAVLEQLRTSENSLNNSNIASKLVRELPIVTIGHPEVWSMEEIFSQKDIPPVLSSKLDEADFYLVRMACSFRPPKGKCRVTWARFLASLFSEAGSEEPVAFDLYPKYVTQEIKRDVSITITPSLKFDEIEAKAGEFKNGIKYDELHPIISAAGTGESMVSWDFQETKGTTIQGVKCMYILLKKVKSIHRVGVLLDLVADVLVRNKRIPVLAIKDKKEASESLVAQLI